MKARPETPASGPCGGWVGLVAACTALGAGLRFWGLGRRDFWFDESCTFVYVSRLFEWSDWAHLLRESTNLPYYFLLRGWTDLLGESESAYRSLSALAAMLTIPVLAAIADRLAGKPTAAACALLTAFNPLHLHYSHEARAYALWVLLLSLALLLLVEAVSRKRWRWWLAYASALTVCLYLHYFTVFWAAASFVCLFRSSDRRRAFGQCCAATSLSGLAFLPYVVLAVLPAAGVGGRAWLPEDTDPLDILRSLWVFLPAGAYPAHLRGLSVNSVDSVATAPAWMVAISERLPILLLAALIALPCCRWINRERLRLFDKQRCSAKAALRSERCSGTARSANIGVHLFLGGLTLGPLVLAWLFSAMVQPSYLVGRYDLVAWPAFTVWFAVVLTHAARAVAQPLENPNLEGPSRAAPAAGARNSQRQFLMITCLCVPFLACSAVPIGRMAALRPGPSFPRVRAHRLAELARPGDIVIAFSYDRDYLQYYLHRFDFQGTLVSFPSWLERQVGWVDTSADAAPQADEALKQDAAHRAALVHSARRAGSRVFLLGDSLDPRGTGARGSINARLLSAIGSAGYVAVPLDPELLIAEVVPSTGTISM